MVLTYNIVLRLGRNSFSWLCNCMNTKNTKQSIRLRKRSILKLVTYDKPMQQTAATAIFIREVAVILRLRKPRQFSIDKRRRKRNNSV